MSVLLLPLCICSNGTLSCHSCHVSWRRPSHSSTRRCLCSWCCCCCRLSTPAAPSIPCWPMAGGRDRLGTLDKPLPSTACCGCCCCWCICCSCSSWSCTVRVRRPTSSASWSLSLCRLQQRELSCCRSANRVSTYEGQGRGTETQGWMQGTL